MKEKNSKESNKHNTIINNIIINSHMVMVINNRLWVNLINYYLLVPGY